MAVINRNASDVPQRFGVRSDVKTKLASELTKDRLKPPPNRFHRYPRYKESGVEWLGEIPTHWDICRLKSLLNRNDSGTWSDQFDPEGTVVLRSTDVTLSGEWKIEDPARLHLEESKRVAALLEEGDLVVTKSSGSPLHLGKTAIVTPVVAGLACCFSNFMQRLRATADNHPNYIAYLLNSVIGREQLNYFGSTTTGLANLNGRVIGSIYAPQAPLDEQKAISGFLEREVTRLDALLERKERLIELLQEKRSALITQAVTKGLNSDVPMKDSGVEWLERIPQHWKLCRLKYLVPSLTVGIVVTPAKYYVDDGVPCLRSLNISSGRLNTDHLVYISEDANEVHKKSKIFEGDLVLVRTGRAGAAVIVPKWLNGANCVDLLIIRQSRKISSELLLFYANSYAFTAQIDLHSVGALQPHFNTSTLGDLLVPIPPVSEQREILTYLYQQTKEVEAIAERVQTGIDRLMELRTTLIYAAVTGKIDVREEVV